MTELCASPMFNYYWISASSAKAVRCSSSDDVFTTRMYRRVLDEMHGLESNRWKSERRDGWSQTEQSEYGSGHRCAGRQLHRFSQPVRPTSRATPVQRNTSSKHLVHVMFMKSRHHSDNQNGTQQSTHLRQSRWCRKIVTTEQMPGNTSSHVEHGGSLPI